MAEGVAERLLGAIRKQQMVVLACHCSVQYSGRAESFLDFGDRVVLIKADKALLVHQATGNNPVNYMKPGASYRVKEEEEGNLLLLAENHSLKEWLKVQIKEVYFFNAHTLEDANSIIVEGTEKDMSDMIYTNPEVIESGLRSVSQEEQTKYGFIDVLCHDTEGNLCVIECKRFTADLKAVDQLRRYVEKIKVAKGIEKVRGIIACPKITSNALQMLQDWGFSHVSVHAPKRYERYEKKQTTLESFQ